jgi:hypothetical protein
MRKIETERLFFSCTDKEYAPTPNEYIECIENKIHFKAKFRIHSTILAYIA